MPRKNRNDNNKNWNILNKILLVFIVTLLTSCNQNYGCITANQSTMSGEKSPPILRQTNVTINANGNYQSSAQGPIYNEWVDTGITLKAGDIYQVTFAGHITLCNTAASPDISTTLSQQLSEQINEVFGGNARAVESQYIGRCYYVDAGNPCGVDTGIFLKSGGHLTITFGDVGQPGCPPSSNYCPADQPGCNQGVCIPQSTTIDGVSYTDASACQTQMINNALYSSIAPIPASNQWGISMPYTDRTHTPRTYSIGNVPAWDHVNFSIGGLYGYNINTFYFKGDHTRGSGFTTLASYNGGPITFSTTNPITNLNPKPITTTYSCNPQAGVAEPTPGTPLFRGAIDSVTYMTNIQTDNGYNMKQIDIPSLNLKSSGNLFINFTYPSNYGTTTPVMLFDTITNPNNVINSPISNNWQYNYGGQSVYIYYNDCKYYSGYRTELAFVRPGKKPMGGISTHTNSVTGKKFSVYEANNAAIYEEAIVMTEYGGNGVVSDTYKGAPAELWVRVFDDNSTLNGIVGDGNYDGNSGAYTAQIIVESPATVQPGPISCCIMSIICDLQDTITTAMSTSFSSFAGNLSFIAFIHALLSLFVIVWGIMIILGLSQITQKAFILNIIKMAIVIALTRPDSYNFFYTYFINLFMGGATTLVSIFSVGASSTVEGCSGVCSGCSNMQNPFTFVDDFVSFIFNTNTIVRMLALILTGVGIILVALIVYGLYKYFLAMLRVMIAYIYALVILGFLFYIAPIFISCILFKPTMGFFNNWKNMVIRYTIEPTILLIGIVVINEVIKILLWGSLQYSICFKCTLPIYLTIVPLPGEPPLFCIPWFFPWGYDPLTNGIWMFFFAFISIVVMFVMSVRLLEKYTEMATTFAENISSAKTVTARGSPADPGNRTANESSLASLTKNTGKNISGSMKALRESSIAPDMTLAKEGGKALAKGTANLAKKAATGIANSKVGKAVSGAASSVANSSAVQKMKQGARGVGRAAGKVAAVAIAPGAAINALRKGNFKDFDLKKASNSKLGLVGLTKAIGKGAGSALGVTPKGLVNWAMGKDSPFKDKQPKMWGKGER